MSPSMTPNEDPEISSFPEWARPFATGEKMGRAAALLAYAAYYGVDGSADDDSEGLALERMPVHRPPVVGYASRTGTRRNLAALAAANWKLLISAKGVLRTEGMDYAIDNGAWTAFQTGQPFDETAFSRVVDRLGEQADWIVVPDIVAGGLKSLDYSLTWLNRLRGLPTPLLIAVQDGMTPADVSQFLSPAVGIFIGGSTEWKESSAQMWGELARKRNCYLHVGRVNSQRRIAICAAAGASSFDGTSVSMFAKSMPRLDAAKRQPDMFAASSVWKTVNG